MYICRYCKKQKNEVASSFCPQSPNSTHDFESVAYKAGAKLGEVFFIVMVRLLQALFSKPASVAGLIIRGVVFGVVGFFIATIVVAGVSNDTNLSFALGALAGVAVFGLYVWYFKKSLMSDEKGK